MFSSLYFSIVFSSPFSKLFLLIVLVDLFSLNTRINKRFIFDTFPCILPSTSSGYIFGKLLRNEKIVI